jgi:hypothetical protein
MYKKISHTITEEHFHHPMALEMSAVLAHHANTAPHHQTLSNTHPYHLTMHSNVHPHHMTIHGNTMPHHDHLRSKFLNVFAPNTNTNSAIIFRQSIRDYFTHMIADLRRYAESLFSGSTTLADQKAYILNQAGKLANLIDHGAWSITAAATLNSDVTNLVTSMMNYADAIKTGNDPIPVRNQIISATQALGQFISSSNPQIWPGTSLSDTWVPAVSAWQDLVAAISQKNFIAEQAASNVMSQSLVTGQSTGVLSFADALSLGIIQLYPGTFVRDAGT